MKDYYTILGVGSAASQAEIKTAFRRLAIQYHPDKNPAPGAATKFYEINEAYDVLGDARKRRQYDELRANPFATLFQATPEPPPHRDPAYRRRRGAPTAPKEPPVTFVMMQRYLPRMMWISRAGLVFVVLFIADIFLPYQQRSDEIVQIEGFSRGLDAYYDLVTEGGEKIRLDDDHAPSHFSDRRIQLSVTRVFASVMYAGNPETTYTELIARMYTTHVFFPILLLLTSSLAMIYRSRVEFCFSLNLAGLVLLILNLVLI